jgi:outer membrane protein OmpA-like peptidoglycan-associated protein
MSKQTHIDTRKTATNDPIGGNRSLQRKCACGKHTTAGGECDECRQQRLQSQRQATHRTEETGVPPVVHEALSMAGRPLDTDTRQTMEANLGQDLSQVRIHTDDKAADSAEAINAQAYTVGQDIVFGKGKFATSASEGQKLLAHELAHVTQQTSSDMGSATDKLTIGEASDTLEQEADKMADDVVSGEHQTDAAMMQTAVSTAPLIQRDPLPGNLDTTLRVSPFMARSMGSLTLTHFAIDSAALTSDHQTQLTELAGTLSSLLRQYPGGLISIAGHTDATGSEEHNLDLGQRP